MPFTSFNRTRLSDLVQNELAPSVGFSRQDINVTPAGKVKMGTVVFRAKDAANTDETPYAMLTDASALADTNEFAIVFGNEYSCQDEYTPRAIEEGQFNSVAFVGKNGALILKERLVQEYVIDTASLTQDNFETLRELLKAQGIILETTI